MSSPRWPFTRIVPIVVASLLVAACGSSSGAVREWTATADVQGNRVRISVDVPGWVMTQDYHPHYALDNGPEVMAYASTYTFSNLTSGQHRIRVVIADPQHQAIRGMEKVLDVTIEAEASK